MDFELILMVASQAVLEYGPRKVIRSLDLRNAICFIDCEDVLRLVD